MGTGNKFTISRVRYNTVLRNGGIISPPERNRIHPRFRCEGRVDTDILLLDKLSEFIGNFGLSETFRELLILIRKI